MEKEKESQVARLMDELETLDGLKHVLRSLKSNTFYISAGELGPMKLPKNLNSKIIDIIRQEIGSVNQQIKEL